MPDNWDKIFRQVALRANQMQADSASALRTNYVNTTIGQTELSDRAIEFPKEAIDDAILNACDKLIGAIANNRHSIYRLPFTTLSSNIASGAALPTTDSTSVPRVGVIGNVFSTVSAVTYKLVAKPYQQVVGAASLSTTVTRYWYFTDNHKIWHTSSQPVNVEVVSWSKDAQRTAMAATPRGACPFSEDLHEAIVCGALSYVFRSNFNSEQVGIWRAYFTDVLNDLKEPGTLGLMQRQMIE